MNLKEKLKKENGGTWLSAILITIVVILIVVVLVSIISLAKNSVQTLEDMKQNEAKQDPLSMFE